MDGKVAAAGGSHEVAELVHDAEQLVQLWREMKKEAPPSRHYKEVGEQKGCCVLLSNLHNQMMTGPMTVRWRE